MITPPSMTVMGAGSYGVKLVGGLFSTNKLPQAQLTAYVDPSPNLNFIQDMPIGQKPGLYIADDNENVDPIKREKTDQIPIFKNLASWKAHFKTQIQTMIVDLALPETIVPKVFHQLVQAQVKNIILPKPVSFNTKELEDMEALSKQEKVKSAVASNWFYSQLSQTVAATLAELQKQFSIQKAQIHYSKQSSKKIPFPPAHSELPHALQILDTVKLINCNTDKPVLKKSSSQGLEIHFSPSTIREGVDVISYTDQKFPSSSGRMRQLNIFLDDGDPEPDMTVDYDVQFDVHGKITMPGKITIDAGQGENRIKKTMLLAEEDMVTMYQKMIQAFRKPYKQFMEDPNVLTLQRYLPLAKTTIDIHEQWLAQQKKLPQHVH